MLGIAAAAAGSGRLGRKSPLQAYAFNERGEKRFLAIEDGVRESTQSWREVLLRLKSRGMKERPEAGSG